MFSYIGSSILTFRVCDFGSWELRFVSRVRLLLFGVVDAISHSSNPKTTFCVVVVDLLIISLYIVHVYNSDILSYII